jgi:hypothetical protein
VTGEVRSNRAAARMPFWLQVTNQHGDDLRFHEAGVEIIHRSRTERVRWDEVREVRTLARTPALEHYRLETHSGDTHEIRIALPDGVSAFAQLHEPTLRHLLVTAIAALRDDGIAFGVVRASARGVHSAFAELRWERIADVHIEPMGERLVLRGRDHTWMEFALADVPNPHVLIALCRELRAREDAPISSQKETAYAALKRLAEAAERAPDAMTIGYSPRRRGPIDSSD